MARFPVLSTHSAHLHAINIYRFFVVALLLSTAKIIDRPVNAQEEPYDTCTTPNGEPGLCKSIIKCPELVESVPSTSSINFGDYLKTFHCGGFDGLWANVCCKFKNEETTASPTTLSAPSGTLSNRADLEYISDHENLRLLPIDNCGPILSEKISNGNSTDLFEFPWMVLLQYVTERGLEFQCGGSLISDRYVLTAAHCVTKLKSTTRVVSVRLGEYDLDTEKDCQNYEGTELCAEPVQDVPIERFIAHPQFNRPFGANDIALIRLSKQVHMSIDSVRPICLPVSDEVQDLLPKRVTITGWGTTENQTRSSQLLQASVPVVPNKECQAFFSRSFQLRDTQMCAGGERGVDSCAGDSGGALVYPANVGGAKMVQFGIISLGAKNCRSDNLNPGIYTRVSYYMKWILDNMQE